MKAYFAEMERCSARLLEAFCVGFGLPRHALDSLFAVSWRHRFRWLLLTDQLPRWTSAGRRLPAVASNLRCSDLQWVRLIFTSPAGQPHILPAPQLLPGGGGAGRPHCGAAGSGQGASGSQPPHRWGFLSTIPAVPTGCDWLLPPGAAAGCWLSLLGAAAG